MSVFDLKPLPVSLKILVKNGWRWKGLGLYQKTGIMDFKSDIHGPIRLIPPLHLQFHLDNYLDGLITKTELFYHLLKKEIKNENSENHTPASQRIYCNL